MVFEKYSLQTKVVGLCANKTNTNFGGAKRLGQNKVWRNLQRALGRNVIGIGCGAHIVHNCLQSGGVLAFRLGELRRKGLQVLPHIHRESGKTQGVLCVWWHRVCQTSGKWKHAFPVTWSCTQANSENI
ncbi:unnamed protein product [Ixodes persulcatus]